jgi:predicted Zn-dependent peptidase
MTTYLSLGVEQLGAAARALNEEFDRLAQAGPSADELERTQASLFTMLVMGQETPESRVMRLGRYGLDQARPPSVVDMEGALARVTREEVQRLAGRWAGSADRALAWTGPAQAGGMQWLEKLWGRGRH